MQRAESPALPHTPQHKSRTPRASKLRRTPGRDTHTDGSARGTPEEPPRDERDSHDLSLTDNTRHSIVDNMLMSLNPDQPKAFSPPQDRPNFSAGSDAIGSQRYLHSSSATSESYTVALSDSPDQRSSQHGGRGRRSNSSSNFQSGLGRIDSVHDSEALDVKRGKRFQVKRAGASGQAGRGHSRQASSKSSFGSTNLDYGQMAAQLKTPAGLNRRSASFDHGYGRGALQSAMSSGVHPPMPSSLSQPHFYNDFEAAPTPTVPGGPRREQSPGFTPQAAPVAPSMQRRNSNKSAKGHTRRATPQWENPAPPINGFMSRRGSKQLPSFLRSRNTSPVRQVSEPVLSNRFEANESRFEPNGTRFDSSGSRFDANNQQKESSAQRPGFFRRVFGSSKGLTPSTSDMRLNATQSQPAQPRANSRNGAAEPNRLHKTPAIEDLSNPSKSAPPPLQKKPSSFFRRRKKSISDNVPPPSLPLHLQQNAAAVQVDDAPRSPVSSLRKVMDPYLDGPADVGHGPAPGDHPPISSHTSRLRGQKSFEPTYPPHDASIESEIRPSQPRELPSPLLGAPSPNAYHSFLNDDSSTENKTPTEPSDNGPSAALQTYSRTAGPTSVPPTLTPQRSVSQDAIPTSKKHGNAPRIDNRSLNNQPNPSPTLESSTRKVATPTRRPASPQRSFSTDDRLWLRAGESDADSAKKEPKRSTEEAEKSPVSDYHSASSTLHPLKKGDEIRFPETVAGEPTFNHDLDKELPIEMDSDEPTDGERLMAKRMFEGDESIATKETAAAWLGDPSVARGRIRKAYMELFKFKNLTILAALRSLCGKLYLKGEAQQVDRILDVFSSWWFTCNPKNGFKATDVVHTICYSLLLLNTDLHQAEIETKMTRTQFLKNILPTIRRVVTDAAPDAFTNARASTMPPAKPWMNDQSSTGMKTSLPGSPMLDVRRSFEGQRPTHRLSQRPSDQAASAVGQSSTPVDFASSIGDCGPLVKTGFNGKLSTWENQIELILKDFYNSIRQQPLPLHRGDSAERPPPPAPQQSSNSLSAMTSNILRRTPSMISKTGSENVTYNRGRQTEGRLGTGRWTSKTRSRPRLYPASTVASSRRSSFDEQSSVTSPSVTSAWSKFSSFGRTQTSFSVDSLGSHFPQADFQQSIGFANALSQAIIREEHPTAGDEESLRAAPLLEDESLELAGAPWAKEGILKHKHHLEAIDKRAKDRNWVESFAVIEKGHMKLFSFNMNAKSLRSKNKSKQTGGAVGGGNWMENAETLGSFVLRQTIASALPPPGYSKARPHVWALSLPTGAVHLFQVGTPEIVKEFVTTANYWSARLSKEPLVGAISNIEYGWGEGVINTALLSSNHSENTPLMPSNMSTHSVTRPSLQSSIRSARSSMDQSRSFGPKLPGDKITIHDWTPPQQSMVASALMEVDQLRQLMSYVRNIEEELQRHNELRGPMLLAVSLAPWLPFQAIIRKISPFSSRKLTDVSLSSLVLPPPTQLYKSHDELGAQILLSPARDCQV